jgi:hypothetical protein
MNHRKDRILRPGDVKVRHTDMKRRGIPAERVLGHLEQLGLEGTVAPHPPKLLDYKPDLENEPLGALTFPDLAKTMSEYYLGETDSTKLWGLLHRHSIYAQRRQRRWLAAHRGETDETNDLYYQLAASEEEPIYSIKLSRMASGAVPPLNDDKFMPTLKEQACIGIDCLYALFATETQHSILNLGETYELVLTDLVNTRIEAFAAVEKLAG